MSVRSRILWFYLSFSVLEWVTAQELGVPTAFFIRVRPTEWRVGGRCIRTRRRWQNAHVSAAAPRSWRPSPCSPSSAPPWPPDGITCLQAEVPPAFCKVGLRAAVALPGPSRVTVLCSKSEWPTLALFFSIDSSFLFKNGSIYIM